MTKHVKQISFQTSPSKACAICHSRKHKGFLTVAAVREHKCIEKGCPRFQKLEHDFWTQKERKSLEKKARKYYMEHEALTKNQAYWKAKNMLLEDLRALIESAAGR